MIYRAIGLMSGSSLDGLDMVFASFEETGGKWTYEIKASACMPYSEAWTKRLRDAESLSASAYLRLHADYGHYLGQCVNSFVNTHGLEHQVQMIGSHGHTVFHEPQHKMTSQLGDGAAVAAVSGINVISDLRAMDVAHGGQGAPIVPMGEQLLFSQYPLLLNLGGIANLSARLSNDLVAFDICPANRVLNMLAAELGLPYDDGGKLASEGFLRDEVLARLNGLDYYDQPYPKSLANDFGTDVVYPLIKGAHLSTADAMRTMTEHVAIQTTRSIGKLIHKIPGEPPFQMLVTGGGAFNHFLTGRLQVLLGVMGVEVVVPESQTINYKEALIMALLAVLRWREENTVLHSVTGASRSSIGGAVWMGQEA